MGRPLEDQTTFRDQRPPPPCHWRRLVTLTPHKPTETLTVINHFGSRAQDINQTLIYNGTGQPEQGNSNVQRHP